MKLLRWLTVAIVVVILAEGALLAAVVLDSDAERRARKAGSDLAEAWMGNDESEGILATYGDAADDFIDRWVRPLWSAPEPHQADQAFSGCLACHVGYTEKRKFDDLYFNHPVHQESGLGCMDCHTNTAHPSPPPPEMETCAECHTEVTTPGECQLCHAPGTLSHFERLGVGSNDFENCGACHLPGSLERTDNQSLPSHPTFNGVDSDVCLACHATDWCARCHEDEHPDDWVGTHGQSVLDTGGNCFDCHTGALCGPCHEGAATKLPLPIGDSDG